MMQRIDSYADIENQNRFYNKRTIDEELQSQWIFSIYQKSMFARIMAIGFLTLLITIITIVYFTKAINLFLVDIFNLITDYKALT
jgi:hypothetical protein